MTNIQNCLEADADFRINGQYYCVKPSLTVDEQLQALSDRIKVLEQINEDPVVGCHELIPVNEEPPATWHELDDEHY